MWYLCEKRYGWSRIKTGPSNWQTLVHQELFWFGNTMGKIILAIKMFYHHRWGLSSQSNACSYLMRLQTGDRNNQATQQTFVSMLTDLHVHKVLKWPVNTWGNELRDIFRKTVDRVLWQVRKLFQRTKLLKNFVLFKERAELFNENKLC